MGNLVSSAAVQPGPNAEYRETLGNDIYRKEAIASEPANDTSRSHLHTVVSAFQSTSGTTINGGTFNIAGGNVTHVTYMTSAPPPGSINWILDLLPPSNFRVIQMDTHSKRTPNTGRWFIESDIFQAWITSQGGILWGMGMAGAGKTILASIVISYLETFAMQIPGVIVAYAYCRYSESMSVVDVLLSLVRQQLERNPFIADIIGPAFAQHQRENTRPSQDDLLHMLIEISKRFGTTFYCLEALDEAPLDAHFDLVEALSSIKGHFFITSRHLGLLKKSFPDATFFEVSAHDEDINLFVEHQIARNPALLDLVDREGLREELFSAIIGKSRGMFLYASLQMETLRHCYSVQDLQSTMEELPLKLEESYTVSFKRIESQPEKHAKLAKLSIVWVITANRSLTFDELQFGLTFRPGTRDFNVKDAASEAFLLSLNCGLLTVDKESRLVRLVHYTAKEVLKSLLAAEYPQAHQLLADACIARLISCGFQESTLATVGDLRESFRQNPLLSYAHEYWASHALHCPGPVSGRTVEFVLGCTSFPCTIYAEWAPDDARLDALNSLHVAAFFNFPEPLTRIVVDGKGGAGRFQKRLDINSETSQDRLTPLMLASYQGHEGMLRSLLKVPGIDVNQGDRTGWTALMFACDKGHESVIQCLLDVRELQVNLTRDDGITSLMLVSGQGQEGALDLLLNAEGIEVNQTNRHGVTALMMACNRGQDGTVRRLCAVPEIDINIASNTGWTALIYSTIGSHERTVAQLLQAPRIDVNKPSDDGNTPLEWAVIINESKTILEQLVEFPDIKPNLADNYGDTPLISAVILRSQWMVERLLKVPGINANATDKRGWTALIIAAQNGDECLVELLLRAPGIEPDLVDEDGDTALMAASRAGREEVVKLLLEVPRIKVDFSNKDGTTALASAAELGHEGIVQLLLEKGATLCGPDDLWDTPLMLAAGYGHSGVVQHLLCMSGIDVNAAEENGWTALMLAASEGHRDAVKLLLEAPSVVVDSVDKYGFTAQMWALQYGYTDIVDMLCEIDT